MWKNRPKITFKKFIEDKKSALRDLWDRFLIALHIRKAKIEKKKNILPDLPEEKIDMGAFIEKHRFAIGAALLILILISGGFLLYRENYFKPVLERKIAEQDKRIEKLEMSLEELSSTKAVATTVPTQSAESASTPEVQSGSVSGASTATATKRVGKVNINTASAAQLDTLPGIGTAYAGRIIEYRTSHGGFKSTIELKNVKGIGDKTFEKLADLVTI